MVATKCNFIMAKQTAKKPVQPSKAPNRSMSKSIFPLDKINFIMIACSLALIVIGFLLMTGSANTGDTFNNDIFSTRRVVLGPLVALAGFVLMVPAIMYKKKVAKPQVEQGEDTIVKE